MTHLMEIKEAIKSMVFKKAHGKESPENSVVDYLDHSLKLWSHSPTVSVFLHALKSEIEDMGINMFCRLYQQKIDAQKSQQPVSASYIHPSAYESTHGGMHHD